MKQIKSLIAAGIESPYGTDAVPAPTTNAIIVLGEVKIEPVVLDKEKNVIVPFFGKPAPLRIGESIKLSFQTELKGGGAAGTAPAIDPLLRAMGLTKSTSTGVSVTYAPNSSYEAESASIYYYVDGIRHKALGCVCSSATFTFKTPEVITIDWEFIGMFASAHAADVTWPATITFDSVSPVKCISSNFAFTPNGGSALTTLMLDQFTMQVTNNVIPQKSVNAANGIQRFIITNREVKGTFNPEVVALSVFNPWTNAEAASLNAMEIKPSGSEGNLVELTLAGVVLATPKYGKRDEVQIYELDYTCHTTLAAGNTEFSLVIK